MDAQRVARVEQTARRSVATAGGVDVVVPNIMDFVVDPSFLGRESLYPLQALILKLMFLAEDLLTDWDHEQLAWLTADFRSPEGVGRDRFEGGPGLQPDVLERMRRCRADGRRWFREVVMVVGRRGGKGIIGAMATAYVLWHYLALGDPHGHFGIAHTKPLSVLVFGGKKQQAQHDQFAELAETVRDAPCFAPFLAGETADSLSLWSPAQLAGDQPRRVPALEIMAKESTRLGGRGPASCALLFDEMAYVVPTGTTRSAEEVYASATPAVRQFGTWGFVYEASSPWQQTGQFYENACRALEIDVVTGGPRYHDMFLLQLPSWKIYEGWELTK